MAKSNSRDQAPNVASPVSPYVSALALGVPAILLGIQLSGWIAFVPVIRHGHPDFRNLYTAGYMLRSGHRHELYDYSVQKYFQDSLVSHEEVAVPFIRPAYQALLFVPFSFLPFGWAYLAFLATNISVVVLCFKLLRPYMGNLAYVWPGLPYAMFVFTPVAAALMQGQDSIILLMLLAVALLAIDREWEMIAGASVGLGLFKLQIVLPIAVLFFAWRRWRFSAGFALSAIMLAGLSVWIVGRTQSEVYVHSMLNVGISRSLSSGAPLPVDHMANLHGLLSGIVPSTRFAVPLTVAISVIMLVLAAKERPHGTRALGIAITVGVVVSHYLFIHDMTVLLIPLVMTLDGAFATHAEWGRHQYLNGLGSTALFAAPAWISFAPDDFYLMAIPLLFFALVILFPNQARPMAN